MASAGPNPAPSEPPAPAPTPAEGQEQGGAEEENEASGGADGNEEGFLDAGDVAYTEYQPAEVEIGKKHPDVVVENTSLAAVQPPKVTYVTRLPPDAMEQLSNVQMESVIYAGQQFEKERPLNGERRGFMIGDGAGVGKGRQLAALILDAWKHGHKRHIWISVSPDLCGDSERDLRDIKARDDRGKRIKVRNISDFDYKADLDFGDGVLFSTYKSLTMSTRDGGKKWSRFEQMVKWFGGLNGAGCILFDEAHKAKNLYSSTGETQSGLRVKEIQDACPNARVVYCSATPCSEPMNMGYMTRLGMWGEGTQFEDFRSFLKDVENRGVGAMELVAMQLKAEGKLLSRSLSFEGCEFSLLPLINTKWQIDLYNASTMVWQLFWQVLTEAAGDGSLYTLVDDDAGKSEELEVTVGPDGELEVNPESPRGDTHGKVLDNVGGIEIKMMTLGRMKSLYWAAHQRFFRSMCIAFKVDKAVEVTKKALGDDMCVVIGLQSTGESNQREAAKRSDAELDEQHFLSAPGEILKRLIIKIFWFDHTEEELSDSDEEWSLDVRTPPPKKAKTETAPGKTKPQGTLGWTPPTAKAAGGASASASTSSSSGCGVGGVEAVSSSTPSLGSNASVPSVDDSEGQAAGPQGGGARAGPAPSQPAVPSFSKEDDQLLFGDGDPVLQKRKRARTRFFAFMNRAYLLKLPGSPLDRLVNECGGPNAVAEMTGRQMRMVRAADGNVYRENRDAHNTAARDEQNNFERAEFNHGRKLVAIISDAASAGVSLHANRIYPENRRRRMHITLELPWSADKAIQQLGRSHRANQFHAPVYTLIVSDVSGETRFSAAVAKRLESLGALTQGDRRASHAGAGELGFTMFNIDNQYGKAALDHICRLCVRANEKPVVQPPDIDGEEYAHIRAEVLETRLEKQRWDYRVLSETIGGNRRRQRQKIEQLAEGAVTLFEAFNVWLSKVDVTVADSEIAGAINKVVKSNVARFLNRILGLRIVQQHVLFEYFHSVLEHHVKEAKRDGTFEDGIRALTGASCVVTPWRSLDLPAKTGLEKGELEAVKVTIDKTITFEEVLPKFRYAEEETLRRTKLAKAMRAERAASGNAYGFTLVESNTGFWKRYCHTDKEMKMTMVVDYPGNVGSGFNSGGRRQLIMWFPRKGRMEVPTKIFNSYRYSPAREAEARKLWDQELRHENVPDSVYVVRGPRLLLAWPLLDATYNGLYKRMNEKEVKCSVVNVRPVAPASGAPEEVELAMDLFADTDDEDDQAAMAAQQRKEKREKRDPDKEPFIALQLPNTRRMDERMAQTFFNALERGAYFKSRDSDCYVDALGGSASAAGAAMAAPASNQERLSHMQAILSAAIRGAQGGAP